MQRVVFQQWLHRGRNPNFSASHLSYASHVYDQYKPTVKVHGVFPSCCGKAASSPPLLFHRIGCGDSAQVVTLFMRVGTYPTRNFATLGPSELRPLFTGASVASFTLRLTCFLDIPAPSKRHTVYVLLRVSTVLCF